PIWLNIEWSLRDNKKIKEKITKFVKEHGFPYRVGYQFHKLFQADEMDTNSKPNVPLGGNLDLGY
ncbi:MAG: radical SAM protein, partial [Verrucomicrobiales bacterium]|nr:radical SAM protein [Verrucomicrobiales bacterium]